MSFSEILEKTYKLVEFVETKFSQQLTKRETDQNYEIDFNFFSMNFGKKYIGAFFDSNNNKDLTVWSGYDIVTDHFCVSFYSEKYKDQIKSVLESFKFNYFAEYITFSKEGYWYSLYLNVLDYKFKRGDKELTNSDNNLFSSELEQDIKNILDKFYEKVSTGTK